MKFVCSTILLYSFTCSCSKRKQNCCHILAVSYFNGAKPAYSKRPVLSKLIVNTNEGKTHGPKHFGHQQKFYLS